MQNKTNSFVFYAQPALIFARRTKIKNFFGNSSFVVKSFEEEVQCMENFAIKTAWTGVYFAVPYMAKLIIEFMEKNYQKENRNLRKSRDLLVERILHRYPARRVDGDDDLFDALEEYDSYRNERYECLADDQSKQ